MNNAGYCEDLQRAVDHIEAHLDQKINIADVAACAGYSVTHFYRIFQALVGDSVKSYIQKRRLSRAAEELMAARHLRVIDVAFLVGFHSQEVFTRDFTHLFGVTPGQYAKRGAHLGLTPRFVVRPVDESRVVWPKLVLEKSFVLVGMEQTVDPASGEIGALWAAFAAQRDRIEATGPAIGLCEYMPFIAPEDRFRYMACVETREDAPLPAGMVRRCIPRRKYAVFAHRAGMDTLKATYDDIYGAWLPLSGERLAQADTLEIYPQTNAPGVDIYIPLQ